MLNFLGVISFFGDIRLWASVAIVSIIAYFFIPKKMKKHLSWFIFGGLPSIAISWFIVEILKLIFKVPRPCFGLDFCPISYSFPSGHAAVIFAVMTVAITYSKSRKLDVLFFTLALLVSLSRVFLGVHTIQDITVGGLIGFIVGFLVYRNYKEILHRVKLRI